MPREWSEWHGGACPVPVGTRVDVRHRDGGEWSDAPAGEFGYARRWEHRNALDDIVAWRLAEDELPQFDPSAPVPIPATTTGRIHRSPQDDLYAQLAAHAAVTQASAIGRRAHQIIFDDYGSVEERVLAHAALAEPPPKECKTMINFEKTPLDLIAELTPPAERYAPLFELIISRAAECLEALEQARRRHTFSGYHHSISLYGDPTSYALNRMSISWLDAETIRLAQTMFADFPGTVAANSHSIVFYFPRSWEHVAALQVGLVAIKEAHLTDNLCSDARDLAVITREQFEGRVAEIPNTAIDLDYLAALFKQEPGTETQRCLISTRYTKNAVSSQEFCWRPATWPLWQLREHERLRDGTYAQLPEEIAKRIPREVFDVEVPHMAIKGENKGKIAYTENGSKGARDVQTVAKPGRYLRRVVKDLANDQELKEMVASLAAAANIEVKVVHNDFDTFRRVYMEGPSSCMAYGDDKFRKTHDLDDTWRHPAEAYCHPDNHISLAYVEVNDRIAARVLINTDSKQHVSMYCADWAPVARNVLKDWLESEGYTYDDNALRGEIMARINLKNGGVLCPYIDCGGIGVDIEDDHLVVGGDFTAPHDWGYAHPDGRSPDDEDYTNCDDCGEAVHEDDVFGTAYGESVCDSCRHDNYTRAFSPNGYTELYSNDDVIELPMWLTHPRTGERSGHACEDFDLSILGVVRDIDGDVMMLDECYETPDGEYVHRSEVWTRDDPAVLSHYDYILVDDTAHEKDECFFYLDDGCWQLRDDYDLDAMLSEDGIRYRDAETEDEAA